jgi:hypothetical protein
MPAVTAATRSAVVRYLRLPSAVCGEPETCPNRNNPHNFPYSPVEPGAFLPVHDGNGCLWKVISMIGSRDLLIGNLTELAWEF